MNRDQQLKKGSTPTLILAVLSGGPLHGYAIARQIERRSADALSLGEGVLYPALRALERDGFVSAEWQTEGPGPARRVYTLTEMGQAELTKNVATWQTFFPRRQQRDWRLAPCSASLTMTKPPFILRV